jgi:hypothetical protein
MASLRHTDFKEATAELPTRLVGSIRSAFVGAIWLPVSLPQSLIVFGLHLISDARTPNL